MGYTPRAWRQVKIMFIPANGKVNYTQAKVYCPISILYFMLKMMQKFETRNIRDETLGNVRYIYKILPTNQACPQKLQCTT
jgi:ssDNA-binding Zn-finger/Zn-ribbon topoisomerase 1